MAQTDDEKDERKQRMQEQLQAQFMERMFGGGSSESKNDGEIVYVLKEIRDNLRDISRVLEQRR